MVIVRESSQASTGTDRSAAFERIVRHCQRRMVALAFRMLGNLEEARDQAQESFVRLWQHHNWPEEENARFALLTRILINLCIDRLRKRKRHPLLFWNTEELEPSLLSPDEPERELEAGELQTFLESCVARLKPRQKAVFILRDVESYSVLETAKIIGCSENNVLVNLHKARKNLRKWLAPFLNT